MPAPSATDTASASRAGTVPAGGQRRPRARRTALVIGLIICVALLVLVCLLSIAVGSKQIPLSTVLDALRHYDAGNTDHVIIRSLRVPRTAIGLMVGAALGLSGALMQGVTRNPLADP
ncbi:MAG: iron-siderophore transport system permease protein, partial [Kribbellaceae bacterium]|nr:iron-siderophore transport system permease protein [Kribbellaceae bacterium]